MFPISYVFAAPHGTVPLLWTFRYAVLRGAEYRIVGLAPGRWDIYAVLLGRTYRRVRFGTVNLKLGTSVRCDLRQGTGRIKLKLVDSVTGQAFRAERLRAQCTSVTGAHALDAGAKNTTELQLADLLPGEYQIHLKVTGQPDWRHRASVGLGQTIELTVPLGK